MKLLFWLVAGAAFGAWGYRNFIERGRGMPSTEALDEHAQRLTERARAFADSGRQLAEEGRQFAQAARETAQSAMSNAQQRGRVMLDKARAQAGGMREGSERIREDIREGEPPDGASGPA